LVGLLSVRPGQAQSPAAVLRSAEEIHAVNSWNLRQPRALHLEGTLTWIDRERRLLVLQDTSGVIAVQVEAEQLDFPLGHRIALDAPASWPTLAAVPDFPLHPSGSELLPSFEAPTNWKTAYLARVRGYIHPPVTGDYRFQIASDDTSELWLGLDDDPASARPVATVASWTKPREWNHLPTQQSPAIRLEAGRRYYIEAVHEQRWAGDNLSVTWQGPDLPVQIIAGRDLSPWVESSSAPASDPATRGNILREFWFDSLIENAALLTAPRRLDSILAVAGATIRDLGAGALPVPRPVRPGEVRATEDNFRWSQIEGTIDFIAPRGRGLVLELTDGARRTRVVVEEWRGDPPPRFNGRRVRLQGVGEIALDETGERVLGKFWVPSAATIPIVEDSLSPGDARPTIIAELLAGEPGSFRDRAVRLRGRVIESSAGQMVLSDAGSFYASASVDGVNWKTFGLPIEIPMGNTVEIGLVVNSKSTENAATAVFDHVEGLPNHQQTAVGAPPRAGELHLADGSYTIRGTGHDIWVSPDQFFFVHRPLTGAGEIVARVADFTAADPWAKGGLMIRESLAPDAQFVDLVQTGANGLSLQWRKTADGSAPLSVNDSKMRAPHWMKLERRFATIDVRGQRVSDFAPGTQVEVIGYASGEKGHVTISDAACRELTDDLEKPATPLEARPLIPIANVLSSSANADGYDVFKVRGVVTFADEVGGRFYFSVQDHTGAAFVSGVNIPRRARIRAGQYVEIHSNPGWTPPSPNLTAANVFVLGEGVIPPPMRHPVEYSLPRRGAASWIELEGVVRAVNAGGIIELKEKGELFSAAISGASPEVLRSLVDARVRVRGVISFPSEHERLLLVPSLDQLDAVESPPAEPLALPVQPIGELTPAALVNHSMHRVKVKGVVTFVDQTFLYLQDSTGGARIELAVPVSVKLGDEVEAAGFPDAAEDRSLILTSALVRPLQTGAAPPVVAATVEQILSGRLGAKLVRAEAVVSRIRTNEGDATFELQLDQRIFRASLNGPTARLPSMPPGSIVAVTGICVLETALPDWIKVSAGAPSILPARLLLRSTDDLVVLQKPRWWAVKRTLLAISVVGFVLGISLVWIHILRRRVAQRTKELRAAMEKLQLETQTAATLAERNRLAGEIHDSLEQGFSGLILQLDTTAKHHHCPPEVRGGLALARNMVAFSRNEVRHAVWDLQSPVLENSDLGTALKNIVAQLAPETPHVTIKVEGDVRPLSSAIDHHLLRIAQEAITNCVKHASAQNLELHLRYTETEVSLSVRDDGCGFVPAHVLTSNGVSHFGLRSLRGRANKIHGTLTIRSEPGQGTTIEVRLRTPAPPTTTI
jgi:signal transduction histidine kinase